MILQAQARRSGLYVSLGCLVTMMSSNRNRSWSFGKEVRELELL